MGGEETDTERERRLKELWKELDVAGNGHFDVNGLRKGLKKMDHRMPLEPNGRCCPTDDHLHSAQKCGCNVIRCSQSSRHQW